MAEESIDPARLRRRVEEALRETLDAELASGATRPGETAAAEAIHFSRSVGIFFSRSYTGDALRTRLEDVSMARGLMEMDETAFKEFADRLSTVREIAGKPARSTKQAK